MQHDGFGEDMGHRQLGHKALFLWTMSFRGKRRVVVEAYFPKGDVGVALEPPSEGSQGVDSFGVV